MLSFRKLFVLMAIVVAMAAVAGAQQCAANFGAPTIARQEGVAEEVGQVLLTCTGGTPTAAGVTIPNNINVQIYLNTQVTSRLLTDSGWSEALLLLDEPTSGNQVFCNSSTLGWSDAKQTCEVTGTGSTVNSPYKQGGMANTFQGKYTSAVPNSMTFNGIPFDAPGTARNLTMRIVNIRANASAITSSSFIPGNITMFIAITGTGAPGLGNNAQSVVAFVQKGLAFSLRTKDDKTYSSSSLSQCNGNNSDAPDSGKGCVDFRLRFSELFGTAFRPKQSLAAQDSPGAIYNTEGMYYNTAWSGGNRGDLSKIGLATQGTRLSATFSNIPSGVRVFVTDVGFNGTASSLSDIKAARSSAADGTGLKAGTTLCTYTTGIDNTTTPPTVISGSVAYTEVTSAGVATWEVTAAEASATSSIDFGVLVVYSASGVTPTSSATQVTGNYAPINIQSPIMAARGSDETSTGYPLPRFVSSGIAPLDAFTLAPCRTNLLFPFVTNQAGFDTGIAISNTSMAPTGFTGSQQSGACTINYYGQTTGGGQAPSAQTSASVPAGGQLVFTASAGGGVLGSAASINPTPGFQGYVIAQCNFQYAHGFAFISDMSATKLAEGYLALVLDSAISSRSTSSSESLNN